MYLEMFGISPVGKVEFLGHFGKEEQALRAMDEYTGMGYKKVRYCRWNVR